eukprot:13054022-Alexandrium_andersonii.AAC.2
MRGRQQRLPAADGRSRIFEANALRPRGQFSRVGAGRRGNRARLARGPEEAMPGGAMTAGVP